MRGMRQKLIRIERASAAQVSRALWKGLTSFNRAQAGPLRYKRHVISARDGKGRLLGGVARAWAPGF